MLMPMTDAAGQKRHWVSVFYRCCNVYQRVYFRRGKVEAHGNCPRCFREVRFRLSQDGDTGRFFTADQ